MTFDPSESYDEKRICLSVTGEFQGIGLTAYTSPDADESALTITATEGGNIRTRGAAFRTNGGNFEMETSGDVCLNPSSTRSSEIRAGDGKAIMSTANASYLHDLFVSASKGLKYISGERDGDGDYFGTIDSTGDGLRNGPGEGEGNKDWDQIDDSRTDCGF